MEIKVIVLALVMALVCAAPSSAATTADPYYAMPTYGFTMVDGVPCFGKFGYTLPDYWASQPAEVAKLAAYMQDFVAETSPGGTAPYFVWATDTSNPAGYTLQLGYKPGATTAQLSINKTAAHSLMIEGGVETWHLISFRVTPEGITAQRAGVSISPRTGNQTAALLVFGRCSLADDGIRGLSTVDVSGYPGVSMYDDGQYFGTLDTGGGSSSAAPPDPVFPVVPEGDPEFVPYDTAVWTDRFVPWVKQSIGSSTNIGLLIFAVILAIIIVPRIIKKFAKS